MPWSRRRVAAVPILAAGGRMEGASVMYAGIRS